MRTTRRKTWGPQEKFSLFIGSGTRSSRTLLLTDSWRSITEQQRICPHLETCCSEEHGAKRQLTFAWTGEFSESLLQTRGMHIACKCDSTRDTCSATPYCLRAGMIRACLRAGQIRNQSTECKNVGVSSLATQRNFRMVPPKTQIDDCPPDTSGFCRSRQRRRSVAKSIGWAAMNGAIV